MTFPCWLEEDQAVFDASGDYAPAPLSQLAEAAREEYWAVLALRRCKGLGVRRIVRLLRGFGSAAEACRRPDQWEQFVPQAVAAEFQTGRWRDAATEEWRNAQKSNAHILLWKSSHYPQLLRQLADAPSLLYLQGDATLLQAPAVAIVGTRNPSRKGVEMAAAMGRDLAAAGITVVSGLALGIDRAAHSGAMGRPGRSIGVLGTGVDKIYPYANKDIFGLMARDGLLVSEFPPGTAPNAQNFPIRNRIISGLSLGVLVVEAAAKSGSLLTASLALEQNREVFARPPMDNSSLGCQNLLRQGATPVFSADDILQDLQSSLQGFRQVMSPPPSARLRPPLLTPPDVPERAVPPNVQPKEAPCVEAQALLASDVPAAAMASLREHGPMQIDALGARTGLSTSDLATALLGLELTGQIQLLPGSFYKAT